MIAVTMIVAAITLGIITTISYTAQQMRSDLTSISGYILPTFFFETFDKGMGGSR